MKESLKMAIMAMVGGLFSTILVLGVSAIADNDPGTDSVPKLIPYHGTLEKDGHGVNGAVKIHFRIFDGKDAPVPVWDETLSVQVYNGKFTALLGSSKTDKATALTRVINNADDLYLGVAIVTQNGEVALSNKQRFLPVPYALWTTAATDFKVGHDLNVGHELSVGNNITIHGTDIKFGNHTNGNGGRALTHDKNDTLVLNYHGDFSGGTRVDSDLNVGGRLTVFGTDFKLGSQQDGRGSGGRALVHDGGNVLAINYSKDFSGGTRVDGNLTVKGRIKNELVYMKKIDMGTKTSASTNMSASDWYCTVGSIYFGSGDIDEHAPNGSPIMKAYTYVKSNTWWIAADFKSEKHSESHKIGVLCFRKDIVTQKSWF